jgi:hypothetical protein
LTIPELADNDSSEQPEAIAATVSTIDTNRMVCRFMNNPGL